MNRIGESDKKPSSRWVRVAIAFVLSAVFPGLGQLYNRQPRKGLWIATTLVLLVFLEGVFHTFDSFAGLIIHVLLWDGGRLLVLVDACYGAWTGEHREASFRYPRIAYSILGLSISCLAILPATDWFAERFLYIRAFRIPSDSMCPTVCIGERLIADMHVFKTRAPRRGDIIIFLHKSMDVLFTKRVIGVGGDTVEPGQEDTILVNGKPIAQSETCGKSKVAKSPNDEPVHFDIVRVPEGSFFVIGDNLDHSLDSRTSEFGLVKPDQVRGKPLFLYWSDGKSRIGCRLR